MFVIRFMTDSVHLLPIIRMEVFQKYIRVVYFCFDIRKIDRIRVINRLIDDFRSSDHKSLVSFMLVYELESFLYGTRYDSAFKLVVFLTGYNNGNSSWKRFADRLDGFAPHNHMTTHRLVFKKLQIIGQVPGQTVVFTDRLVLIGRDDNTYSRHCSALL